MSFYSSQVGKKSSRYCDSSLYGNNLSSVYADGPPPLDDSTQDEDDDEMVFKSTNREKSPNRQENTDKTTKDIDAQPWPNSSQNADNSSANDDFGDFSSFADFSSAFGGTKDTTTESQSTWFGTNGDRCHSTGKSLKKSNQEVKATKYSDDDEFGCFSGGDESDIENYKTFPEKPQTNSDLKSENVPNGISHNLVTQQSDSSTQHGINQSNVLQTDLFSDDDDDDDEMNDFESPNPGKTGIACPPKNSINDNEPMSPLSVDIPPILSDDNDDDDDGFGDFSSSNFSTSNYGSNMIPNTTVYQKSPRFQISPKCESNAQQDTKSNDKSENLPKTSTWDGQHKDVSYNSISEEQKSSNKQVDFVDQKSINSISQQGSSNIDDSDEFGDFNAHFGSNEEDRGDVAAESSAASNDAGLQSSNCQSNPSEILEKRNTSKNNEHKGDDFRTVAQSQNEESHDSRKLASSLSQDDEADDFSDFSTVSDEKHKNNTLDGNNGDDFGNFPSTDTNNALFERTAASATPNTQDLGDSSNNFNSSNESKSLNSSSKSITNESSNNSNHSFFKESESKSQLFKENKTSTFSNDSSATIKEHDVEFESFSEETEPTQCNQDSNFAQFSASDADSIKPTDKDGNNEDDDFGDFGSVQNIKSASAKNEDNDFSDFNQPSSNTSGDDDDFGEFGHAADDEFGDFSQSASNKQTKDDDDDDCGNFGKPLSSASKDGDDDGFGDFGQPSTDDSFGAFEQPSKPDNSFGNFGRSSTTKLKSGDSDFGKPSSMKPENDNDDFGDFGKPSSVKPDNDDDFGDFGKPSSMTPENDNDDGFGDFSKGTSTTNTGIADCKTSSDSGLPNTKSSDMFSRSEAGNLSSQSFRSQSPVTMATSKDIQHLVASTKASSIFQPQKTPSITVINNLIKQSFVAVQSNIQDSVIAVLLEHELNSGKPSVWGAIKGAGRDGSLRFQWMDSDHKLKMLEALCMLPVRVQTSASFKSSGPVQTPLFASGLGLLEPTKGVITPFHHGVEEIDPSQDPFGAPPEVGIPDLGFGSKGNGSKKDTMPGHLDTRDSSDTISVSSSLDLDFLAPASSTGDLTKPEGKALFEDDLLGLGMQFSATNESPTVFNSSKDQKKIFKFNTSTVSLPSDDKNLSELSRKIVRDFEDLSFMLCKVLMFPLKSDE